MFMMRISLFFVCGYLIILFTQLAQKNYMEPGKLRKYRYQYEIKFGYFLSLSTQILRKWRESIKLIILLNILHLRLPYLFSLI